MIASGGRGRRLKLSIDGPLILLLLAFVGPILWMILLSVQFDRTIISPQWRFSFTPTNVTALFAHDLPYAQQFINSLVIVAGTVSLCAIAGTLAGYGLSKLRISRWLSMPVMAVSAVLPLVPPMALVPGLYVTLDSIGVLGTNTGLILVNTILNLPFTTLLMRVYFDELPPSLREAAMIDGAGDARVLLQIMLPLVKPGLTAACLFAAIMTWNEFLMGLTMTSGGTTAPLTVGIASMVQPYEIHWGEMAAAGTLAVLPIILANLLGGRLIIAGLIRGAVKG